MSRRPIMSALAQTRARNRALRAEMVRLSKMAKEALAEFDELLASRLRRLKAEMAAAHPDHGGSNEAFIAARERYLGAKRTAGVRRPT
jgi:transposase